MCTIFEADGIVSKLVGPEREHHFQRSQEDLYSELCEWKDKCNADVRTRLYAAIEDPKKIKGAYFCYDIIAGNQIEYRNIRWTSRLLVLNQRACT